MVRNVKAALALVTLAFTFGLLASVHAQDSMKHDNKAKTLETGTFHGNVHKTSGRATIYREEDGKARPSPDKLQHVQRPGRTRDSDSGQGRGRRRKLPQERHRASGAG